MACVTFQRQTQKGKMGSGDEEQQPKQGLVSEGGFLCCTWVERPWKNNFLKNRYTFRLCLLLLSEHRCSF